MWNKVRRFSYLIPVLAALVIGIWIPSNKPVRVEIRESLQGVLDLQGWDRSSVVELHGEWRYFGGLLIRDLQRAEKIEYRRIPHLFGKDGKDGAGAGSPYGTGTYQLQLRNLDPDQYYAVQVIDISSAYRLQVNGREVLRSGVVAYDKEGHVPAWKEKRGVFQSNAKGDALVMMEISNFSYFEGGFRNYITMGRVD